MDGVEELEARLHRSLLNLRAWRWMSRITTNPEQVALLLTAEARELIELGRQNPAHAKQIGKLIVGYHNLIVRMKRANACRSHSAGQDGVTA